MTNLNLIIREFDLNYADGVRRLYEKCGYKFSSRLVDIWMKYERFSKVLLAIVNGEVVGKVTFDIAYKPYAEIVNLIVHPNYRGLGIGSKLVEECISRAKINGFNIIYLMTDIDNRIAHKLYSKYNFIPTILPGKRSKRKFLWLFKFLDETFMGEFKSKHPFIQYITFRKRISFMKRKFYCLKIFDPISNDQVMLYFRGQPGQVIDGTCPRIAGLKLKIDDYYFGLIIKNEELKDNFVETELRIMNFGKHKVRINNIEHVIPFGIKFISDVKAENVLIDSYGSLNFKFKYKITNDFIFPELSFKTILVSYYIYFGNLFNYPLIITAGFNW